jgi:hypothetical protein
MSTDYGFKCINCDEYKIIDNFRSPALLRTIVDNAHVIHLVHDLGVRVGIEFYDTEEAFTFLFKHKDRGHRVEPVDEYGRLVGQCYMHVKCVCCGAERPCLLRAKHDGNCSAEKPQ